MLSSDFFFFLRFYECFDCVLDALEAREVIRFSRTKVAESYESSCRYWELNPRVTSGQSLSHLSRPSVKSSMFHFVPFFSVPLCLPFSL